MTAKYFKQLFSGIAPHRIYVDFPMNTITAVKTGGNAKVCISVASAEEIIYAKKICAEHGFKVYTVGNCSKIAVNDSGLDGVVLWIKSDFSDITINANFVYADAGASMIKLSKAAAESGLSGMEFCCGLPATVGGAAYMNAGCYGSSFSEIVSRVYVLRDCSIQQVDKSQCNFGYRSSVFQHDNSIILGADFVLNYDEKPAIAERMGRITQQRVESSPRGFASCGSAFKRPKDHYAAQLIEKAGLKGYTIGGAQVSDRHCGYIVNLGNATTSDIRQLVDYVADTVKKHSGIQLEPEIIFMGD